MALGLADPRASMHAYLTGYERRPPAAAMILRVFGNRVRGRGVPPGKTVSEFEVPSHGILGEGGGRDPQAERKCGG